MKVEYWCVACDYTDTIEIDKDNTVFYLDKKLTEDHDKKSKTCNKLNSDISLRLDVA